MSIIGEEHPLAGGSMTLKKNGVIPQNHGVMQVLLNLGLTFSYGVSWSRRSFRNDIPNTCLEGSFWRLTSAKERFTVFSTSLETARPGTRSAARLAKVQGVPGRQGVLQFVCSKEWSNPHCFPKSKGSNIRSNSHTAFRALCTHHGLDCSFHPPPPNKKNTLESVVN